MKFSKQKLSKLKQKNKQLNPSKYKKLKRDSIRGRIKGTSERPRLSIYRSNEHLYVQIINDETGNTLIVCSTRQRAVKLKISNGRTREAANILGEELAKQSLKKGIIKVVFDRSIYMYHGRIQALTEAARNNGLQF